MYLSEVLKERRLRMGKESKTPDGKALYIIMAVCWFALTGCVRVSLLLIVPFPETSNRSPRREEFGIIVPSRWTLQPRIQAIDLSVIWRYSLPMQHD
jgi:hypothetical protein